MSSDSISDNEEQNQDKWQYNEDNNESDDKEGYKEKIQLEKLRKEEQIGRVTKAHSLILENRNETAQDCADSPEKFSQAKIRFKEKITFVENLLKKVRCLECGS